MGFWHRAFEAFKTQKDRRIWNFLVLSLSIGFVSRLWKSSANRLATVHTIPDPLKANYWVVNKIDSYFWTCAVELARRRRKKWYFWSQNMSEHCFWLRLKLPKFSLKPREHLPNPRRTFQTYGGHCDFSPHTYGILKPMEDINLWRTLKTPKTYRIHSIGSIGFLEWMQHWFFF